MTPNKQYINANDVMEILNINTLQTIYSYISDHKLNPVNKEDWHIDKRYLFDIAEVLQLKKELTMPGLPTSEVAKELGVSQTTVNKYIKKGELPAFKQEFKGLQYHFIKREDLDIFKKNHIIRSKKLSKKNFYNKEENVALFQLFKNPINNLSARILSIREDQITTQTEDGQEFNLEKLLSKGFQPVYEIKKQKIITKEGYIIFNFEIPNNINHEVYKFVDLLHRQASPTNMRIDIENETIRIKVKPILLRVEDLKFEIYHQLLKQNIIEGKVINRTKGIYLDSDMEIIRLKVSSTLKAKLAEKAKRNNTSLEEFLINAAKDW